MKNENVFVEPEGHQDARDRHCVHVSRVQKRSFIFVNIFCLKYLQFYM